MFLKQWVECSSILGVGSGTVYTVPLWSEGTTLYPQYSCKKAIVSQGRLSVSRLRNFPGKIYILVIMKPLSEDSLEQNSR